MPKFFNRRPVKKVAYEAGREETVDLQGSRGILHEVIINVRGKIKLTTSGVSCKPGGMANLLSNVIFKFSGYDPAVGIKYNSQERINLPGRMLALCPQSAFPDTAGRINVLNLYTPLPAGGAYIKDINPTSLEEQTFSIPMQMPMYLPGAYSPRDFHPDMSNTLFVQTILRMGDLKDCFTAAGVAGEITECTFEVQINEMKQAEPLDGRGGTEYPQGYIRAHLQRLTVSADNDNLRRPIQLGGSLLGIGFVGYDENGQLSDDIITKIRIERQGEAIYDLDARAVREENIRDMPSFTAPTWDADNSTVTMSSLLHKSGFYYASPASDPNRTQLTQVPFLGAGNNQAEYVIGTKKPAADNGHIDIILIEAVLSNSLAAATYLQQDQTPVQRGLSAARMAADNDRSKEIEANARAAGANG